MKKISVLMICVSIHTLSMSCDKEVNDIISINEIAKKNVCNISKQLLKPRINRLPVFTELTQQGDKPVENILQSRISLSVPQTKVIFPRKRSLEQENNKKPDLYVIPAKRVKIEKNPREDRKKEVLSFIALEKIHAKKNFKGNYTLYNKKGIITETGKHGSRSFSGKDVANVIVNDDLTINIVLKGDV